MLMYINELRIFLVRRRPLVVDEPTNVICHVTGGTVQLFRAVRANLPGGSFPVKNAVS